MSKAFRPLISARVANKIKNLSQPEPTINNYIINRNPRNLERLRLAYQPGGYHLEKPGRCYWHKLELQVTQRFVTANLRHFENGIILSAGTSEYAIRKQLPKTKDMTAFINLARVFADRCHQSGLIEMRCDIQPTIENGKIDQFLKTLHENGIALQEPEPYKPHRHWIRQPQEKPWEIFEDEEEETIEHQGKI